MNTEIRNQFNEIFAAWSSYTPVWSALGTAPAIGNGTMAGRYMKVGRTCHMAIKLTPGSTTTYGTGNYLWTLPFPAALAGVDYTGAAWLNTGADSWAGAVVTNSTGLLCNPVFPSTATNVRTAPMSRLIPGAFANTDILRMQLTYQTAT
jgi:hypothetical protein